MSNTAEVNRAKAILTTAREFDVYESALPDDDDVILREAETVYEQAVQAWNNDIRGPAVTAVKFAAEVVGATEGEDISVPSPSNGYVPSHHTVKEVVAYITELEDNSDFYQIAEIGEKDARKGVKRAVEASLAREVKSEEHVDDVKLVHDLHDVETTKEEKEEEGQEEEKEEEVASDKTWFDENFEADVYAKAKAKKQNLPFPPPPEDLPDPTMISGTVAATNLTELQERLNDASLCLAAATWQTAIAQIDEEHCQRVGDHYFNKALKAISADAKNATEARAMAEEKDQVKEWRAKQAKAHGKFLTYKSLKEIYKGYYDTVSRVFAIKQEENQR